VKIDVRIENFERVRCGSKPSGKSLSAAQLRGTMPASKKKMRNGATCLWALCLAFLPASSLAAGAEEGVPIHGLWVWKGPTVLESARGVESLRDFCRAADVNEVYVSVSERGQMMTEASMSHMIDTLHGAHIRVEALFSSENADEGGPHLEKLLERVQSILQFNQKHQQERFDGIHLDIEPQQRPENKGPGNLRFLPGLVEAYRAVRRLAEPSGLTVNADIQNKLLKGSLEERRMLLSASPRLTLMMYELSSPTDADSIQGRSQKVETASEKFLEMAYQGLDDTHVARMAIALRTADYGELLPDMLKSLDEANRPNAHYLGWARHSYNDSLPGAH
jgi:hypothetical protein